jgi:hypothetical protein
LSIVATTVHPKSLGEIPKAFQSWWEKYHGHVQSGISFSRPSRFPNLLLIRSTHGPGLRLAVRQNQFWYQYAGRKLHMVLDNFDVSTKVNDRFFLFEIKARRATHQSFKQSLAAIENAKNPLFFRRAINALTGLEQALPQESIEKAIAASTDYLVLLTALTAPSVAPELTAKDPLAAAKLRGAEGQRRLLREFGGVLSSAEVADILQISRQAVDKRRRQDQLIGLTQGKRGYAYPAWQFEGGKTVQNLEIVLDELRGHDPWMQLAFFVNPNDRLDGRTPFRLLRSGELDAVVQAAKAYGEHGAA